jgi:hypothetical protein
MYAYCDVRTRRDYCCVGAKKLKKAKRKETKRRRRRRRRRREEECECTL